MICQGCGRNVGSATPVWPIHCDCGATIGNATNAATLPVIRSMTKGSCRPVNWNAAVCRSGACGHYDAEADACGKVIELGKAIGEKRGGRINWLHSNPDAWCPMSPPMFCGRSRDGHADLSGTVGFLAVSYLPIGGTETWHNTLVPRLENVGGFVSLAPELATGDMRRLGCRVGWGPSAARRLAASVDVLVVWGVGSELGKILPADRPAVVSVSHCDRRSKWTADIMSAQAPWTDRAVYLCPSGIETVPPKLRDTARMIPNGPDPKRTASNLSRDHARRRLGVTEGDRLLVSVSRISPEKRLGELMLAVRNLGDGWHLRIAGAAAGWSVGHRAELAKLETDRVRIIDPVESPADILAGADAYLSAAAHEGYGLSMAEAMLARVPVIATQVGLLESSPELAAIVPLQGGFRTWARAIRDDFAGGKQSARAIAAEAEIRRNHSPDAHAAQWRDLISELAHERRSKRTRRQGALQAAPG